MVCLVQFKKSNFMSHRFYQKKNRKKHKSDYKNIFIAFFKASYRSQMRKSYTPSGKIFLNYLIIFQQLSDMTVVTQTHYLKIKLTESSVNFSYTEGGRGTFQSSLTNKNIQIFILSEIWDSNLNIIYYSGQLIYIQ